MATRTSDHIDQQGNLTGLTLDPNHSSAPINVNQHHASFFNFLSFRVSDFHASLTIRDSGFAFGEQLTRTCLAALLTQIIYRSEYTRLGGGVEV